VGQERQPGRVSAVTPRVVDGTLAPGAAALPAAPVRRAMPPYGVERHHLPVRQHARQLGRTVNACSTEPDALEPQRTLALAYSHFGVPPRRVRPRRPHPLPTTGQQGSRKPWKPVTPAMAAGLTDHVWTMEALLSFRVPP